MNRRGFLHVAGAGAVSLANFPHHLFAAAKPKNATDHILLGPRKIPVSRMAMGTGTVGFGGSSNQTRKLGYKGISELLHAAYDQRVFFWDSADSYGSHTYLREALNIRPARQGNHPVQNPGHYGRRHEIRPRSLPQGTRHGLHRHPPAARPNR